LRPDPHATSTIGVTANPTAIQVCFVLTRPDAKRDAPNILITVLGRSQNWELNR